MRQTCPVKSLTLVVLGWDWVPFLPWNPAKMLLRWEMFIFITFVTTFRYHGQIHLNKLQPESCPCTQESISKKNHANRAKNGKIFTVEFAQKASQPLKFYPTFGTKRWFKKTDFFGFIHHKRCSCSQASIPSYCHANRAKNGKFFTVASANSFSFT